MQKYFYENLKKIFLPTKSCILMAVGRFFFSAALHAQNSPELHFRFINSFIQPSLLESVLESLSITNHFDVHFSLSAT